MAKNDGKNKSKTKSADATQEAPRKKRGQESHFKGARLEFMTENIPGYIAAAKKRGTKESKTEGLTVFWAQFFETYWKKFPWKPSLEEELDPNAPEAPPPQTADEAFAALGLNLSKEEADAKSKVQIETKQKIKRWFGRQRPGAMGIQGNPYFDYKHAVNERFEEECGDEGTGTAKQIARRCAVAKRMYEEEPAEVKKALQAECDEEHAEQMEAYNDEDESMPSPDAEVQEQCRNNFLSIVQPLLAGLHAYTGLTINIIASRINEETKVFETLRGMESANAGTVDGKDWARWDPEGYGTTLKAYLRFVHAGYLEAHNLVDNGGPSASSSSVGQHVAPPTVSPDGAFVGMNMLRMDEDVVMGEPGPLFDDGVDDMLASGLVLPVAPAAPAAPAPVAAPAAPAAPAVPQPAAPAPAGPAPVVAPAAPAAPAAPQLAAPAPAVAVGTPAAPAPVVTPAPAAPP
ncbi:hypothetical protein K438DRAFT_1982930 [Mycena galopus ATCC 62051]|nr:hypothetical protein K438DRAFT_1982930 [Mycena galopus ATCC 62051]